MGFLENALNGFKVFAISFQGVYSKKTSCKIMLKCFAFELISNFRNVFAIFEISFSLLTDAFSTAAVHFATTN